MAYCHQKRFIPDLKSKMDEQILRQAGTRKEWTRMQLIYVTIILKAHFFFWTWESNSLPFPYLKSVQFATSYVVINSATKYIHLIVDNIRIMKEAPWRNLKRNRTKLLYSQPELVSWGYNLTQRAFSVDISPAKKTTPGWNYKMLVSLVWRIHLNKTNRDVNKWLCSDE